MIDQTFKVIYQGENFFVNPHLLANSSGKFRKMISEHTDDLNHFCLKIAYDKFTKRNVENFLKICQNQTTDVQNSELKEICYLSKMFMAEDIYKKSIDYIQNKLDPNFSISDNQFDDINGNQYLILEKVTGQVQASYNDIKSKNNAEKGNESHHNTANRKKKKDSSACYEITTEIPLVKCKRYYLRKDNKILFMAKQKENVIYIGEGSDYHIGKSNSGKTAKIIRDQPEYNTIYTNDQIFKVRFNHFEEGKYSLNVTFSQDGNDVVWKFKDPKDITSYNGFHNHMAIDSDKNILMQNKKRQLTFILRKVGNKTYEAESHVSVDPLIVFAIALSEIVGPI